MTARRIRQVRRRIRVARVVTSWNGFVAALLLSVLATAVLLAGISPSLPVLAGLYATPLAIMVAAALGHQAANPRHAPARARAGRQRR